MKRIIKYTAGIVIASAMMYSCTGNFEEMNTSGVQVNPGDLPLSAQCAEPLRYCYPPQQNMFQFWTNLTSDFYGGYFMTPNGNFSNGDMGENRGHSGGMYENHYLHVFNNTRRLIATFDEAGKPGLAGVMRIAQTFSLMMTTDAYGPLAHSSILSGEYESYYPFDSQQTLYETMIDDINQALDGFNKISDSEVADLKVFDDWCGGDVELWKKICNTMKLRIALRLSKRESEMSADGYDIKKIAAEAASNTLANGGKDILINKQLENEMWLMFAWGDCGFNANLVTLMSGFEDPRQPMIMTKNSKIEKEKIGADGKPVKDENDKPVMETILAANSGYYGIRFASGLPGKPNPWGSFSGWVSSYTAPLPIFRQAESYFLLAEAALRGWISGNVKDLYEEGIKVAIKNEYAYRKDDAKTVKEPTDTEINAYINGLTAQADYVDPIDDKLSAKAVNHLCVKWDDAAGNEDKLARIITQKYLALFPLSTEAWAEHRRTGYPVFFAPVVNESQGNVSSEEGVRRQLYSSNAGDTNAEGLAGGIELLNKENSSKKHSGDVGGTRVWWDNADKGNF